jgi:hypothetical protein
VLNLNVAGLDVAASYRFDTPIGRFNLGAAFTRKTKFDQFSATMAPSSACWARRASTPPSPA